MSQESIVWLTDLPKQSWLSSLFVGRWVDRHRVFARTCRIEATAPEGRVYYRLTFVCLASDYSRIEEESESRIREALTAPTFNVLPDIEVHWKKCRVVTSGTFETESEAVARAIYSLKRNKSTSLIVVEKTVVERGYEAAKVS